MGFIEMADTTVLDTSTHVAFDTPTTERLLQLGALNVVRASDCLLIGPSRRDAMEHARTREAWFSLSEEPSDTDESGEKWDRLYASDVRWDLPVAVWASSNLSERVNLWRTCSWLRCLGIPSSDVLVLEFDPVPPARPRSHEQTTRPFDCSTSVSDHPDSVLLERLDRARPWPPERYDRAVRLWGSYVDENPLPFVESCAQGVADFPELAPLWALLSCFFPRRTTSGALRLSRFDELILTILSAEWQTPLAVAVHESQARMDLWDLLSCTGDLFLVDRLDQWASHALSGAVERAPGPKPPGSGYPMLSKVYRLTEHGARLRDRGLEQLADAPSLSMAGIEAYSTSAPWVLLEDGGLARL
ncbi:hypothetical protein WMF37_13770 [Sorangium sp. So ce291]|uniref:hypothetical protein n=1 Tax=Sorangium sp. So ce291 TaxID=3133294 RepID=UPI003F5E0D42